MLGGPKLHILAGNRLEDVDVAEQYEAMVESYVWAAERLADTGRLGPDRAAQPGRQPAATSSNRSTTWRS